MYFMGGSYNVECKCLEPFYLAPLDSVGSHLSTNSDGAMVWTNDYEIKSPNGTKFLLTVSDDGTLSTTPVTT